MKGEVVSEIISENNEDRELCDVELAQACEEEAISKFRQLIVSEISLTCPLDSIFLIRFIRVKKFDLDRALILLKNYYEMRRRDGKVFLDLYPSILLPVFRERIQTVLQSRDKHGRHIFLFHAGRWNPSVVHLDDIFRSNYLFLEEMTCSADTQTNGIVAIVDFNGFNISQALHFSPTHAKRMLKMIQTGSYPASFKEFHIVNQPYVFNIVFAVVRPFLTEKIRNRIYFHGENLGALHDSFDTDILPESLGGSLPSSEAEFDSFTMRMLEKDDYYKDMLKYGYASAK